MKKLLSLVLCLLLLASLCPALADTPPADQIAASGESYVEWYNRTRANDDLISYIKAGISAGTGYVWVTGTSETYSVVDRLDVVYLIQRWEVDEWVNYYTLGCRTYDSNALSDTRTIDVDSGYYYRLHVIHKAYVGTQSDFQFSVTGSVYVN